MEILAAMQQMGAIQSMARDLGVSEEQATSGAAALLPAILGGFKKQAQAEPAGLAGLAGMLGGLGGGGLLDNVLGSEPTDASRGDGVLAQIFGSKDVSRTVAENATGPSGLDPALLKKMLPILAMLVAGYMAKRGGEGANAEGGGGGGGLGGLLGGLLGAGQPGATGGGARAGGLGGMLDMDGDGNALDDILGMAGKLIKK